MTSTFRRISLLISGLFLVSMVFILTSTHFSYMYNRVHNGRQADDMTSRNVNRREITEKINCSNIGSVSITNMIKDGRSKKVFLGYSAGVKLAVKVASNNSVQTQQCVQYLRSHGSGRSYLCAKMSSMKVMQEILLSQELQHPNIIANLGFCIRGDSLYTANALESYLDDYIVEISEYGDAVTKKIMRALPAREQLRHALDVAGLLLYLENSPLGSVRYNDLRLTDFLLVGSRLKLSAINNIVQSEPYCDENVACSFDLECDSERGYCTGYNARYNNWRRREVMTGILSLSRFPESVSKQLNSILSSDETTASQLYEEMSQLSRDAHAVL